MASFRGRLVFDDEDEDDIGLTSPISQKKIYPGSDAEHEHFSEETPVEFDSSGSVDIGGPIPFDMDILESPSESKKMVSCPSNVQVESGYCSPLSGRKFEKRRPLRSLHRVHRPPSPGHNFPHKLNFDEPEDDLFEKLDSPKREKVEKYETAMVKKSPGRLPRPVFDSIVEEDGMLGPPLKPTRPLTPPSKRFRALCLYDTPNSPKSLLERAQRRVIRTGSRSARSSTGSNRSLLDPEGPQANINPFTPDSDSPNLNNSLDLIKSRPRSKGLKRTRNSINDSMSDMMDEDVPSHKKIALREINTSRYNEEFFEVAKLGDGEFGSVYKCIHRLDGCAYAIKKSKMPVAGSAYERSAMNEVYAHAVLGKHEHVVRYYSAWAENDHMYIQNEFCNGSSLADDLANRLQQGNQMNETELKSLLLQVADGLRYIHSQHLVHLDIKPGNIFLHHRSVESGIEEDFLDGDENEQLETVCYKIGDLGHVTSVQHPEVEEGDVRYLPGEILSENFNHLPKADIFSLALTVYQAGCSRELPKNGPSWHSIRKGFLPKLSNMSTELYNILVSMIQPDPAKRPSAADLLHHPVLRPNHLSKAQLKRQLNEQKFKNEILVKELQELKEKTGLEQSTAVVPLSRTNNPRLIGKANGKKVNRSLSLTCF